MHRDAFPSDRQSFAYRPVELLGIAAGIAALTGTRPDARQWLVRILQRTSGMHSDDGWSRGLQCAAEALIGNESLPRIAPSGMKIEEIALWRWAARSLAGGPADRELDTSLLKMAMLTVPSGMDLARQAVLLQSLRSVVNEIIESEVEQNWQTGRRQRDAESLVVTLCRRFHLLAEQLRHRHDDRSTVIVTDEYDVQDLMHAVLKLHFCDVRPEEVTPSVAGKSGRMDFLLKRERLVVETKMTRKGLDQKKVGDELIIDVRRYREHPDCGTLVCFVYDPSGICHAPDALEHDLSRNEGSLRVIVVVCPKGL